MTLNVWLSLLAAVIVISLTPGAGAINTMANSMRVGWRGAVWGVIGQQVALLVHVIIVAAGVGLIVANSPVLFTVIRYAGAAYLAYLGIRSILTKPVVTGEAKTQAAITRRAMIWQGFWVNILNPKAIVFFLAFIPQFVRADQPQLLQYAIIIGTCVLVDVCVMWGFFATVAKPFSRFSRTLKGQRVLNTVFGALFVGVAVLLLFLH
ncbi:LysE family transporter [Leucobacter sp. cx-328]|uniref:LysE family transporter n=1 Tax=unclassified Leucobacter TaxID=2621730 RepID=UPI00165E52E5|nr:LysE family transporter [Leucobacter sp. cx-328]